MRTNFRVRPIAGPQKQLIYAYGVSSQLHLPVSMIIHASHIAPRSSATKAYVLSARCMHIAREDYTMSCECCRCDWAEASNCRPEYRPTVASVWRRNHLLSAYDESCVVHTLGRLSIGGYVAFNTHSVTVLDAWLTVAGTVCHRPIPNRSVSGQMQ